MNGTACRALAAVLTAASDEDRETYLDRCTELDRRRIHNAMQSFESTFSRRRWRAVVDRALLDQLMTEVEAVGDDTAIQVDAEPFGGATDVLSLDDDVALPEKTRRAINSVLSAQGA
jgi:hypothetical protein